MTSMHAKIEWVDNVHFKAVADTGCEVLMDGPPDAGGQGRGARPMELVLMGLGGCTSYDVVSILRKSRQDVTGCTTEIEAERAENEPKVFTRIHIHFRVTGRGLDHARVARAVALSAEKYCSASIMLERGGVAMSHDFAIVEADAQAVGSEA
jgi:putative redox protein